MDGGNHDRLKPHRRTFPDTISLPLPSMIERPKNLVEECWFLAGKLLVLPTGWMIRLVAIQVEYVTSALLSLALPFLYLYFQSRAIPSLVAHAAAALARRIAVGLLGALYALAVLVAVMSVSVLLGVGLVRLWVEEPLLLRQPLHLDYTEAHPSAALSLTRSGWGGRRVVPTGHTVCVSLVLVLPESNYNCWIGVFQIQGEVISSGGDVIASSSRPCLMRFRSVPVRLMRAFLMGIPLLLGMCSESQKISIDLIQYKETRRRSTEMIRVRLKPRAGTTDLPQLYDAELLLKTKLPWPKELAYNWKWTLYVWTSLHMYFVLLILLACCVKVRLRNWRVDKDSGADHKVDKDSGADHKVDKEMISHRTEAEVSDKFSAALRRWRERSKRKTSQRERRGWLELMESSASSGAAGGEESEVIDDSGEFAASESSEYVGG